MGNLGDGRTSVANGEEELRVNCETCCLAAPVHEGSLRGRAAVSCSAEAARLEGEQRVTAFWGNLHTWAQGGQEMHDETYVRDAVVILTGTHP
ncbi:MAG: hypothetical protein KIA99_07050 [Actinomyces urogenitalis]|nr:hypothetical protein [Actinomyces urogenitalis]